MAPRHRLLTADVSETDTDAFNFADAIGRSDSRLEEEARIRSAMDYYRTETELSRYLFQTRNKIINLSWILLGNLLLWMGSFAVAVTSWYRLWAGDGTIVLVIGAISGSTIAILLGLFMGFFLVPCTWNACASFMELTTKRELDRTMRNFHM